MVVQRRVVVRSNVRGYLGWNILSLGVRRLSLKKVTIRARREPKLPTLLVMLRLRWAAPPHFRLVE